MYDTLSIAQAPGLTMIVNTAAPGTATADALQLLASWAATGERVDSTLGPNSITGS